MGHGLGRTGRGRFRLHGRIDRDVFGLPGLPGGDGLFQRLAERHAVDGCRDRMAVVFGAVDTASPRLGPVGFDPDGPFLGAFEGLQPRRSLGIGVGFRLWFVVSGRRRPDGPRQALHGHVLIRPGLGGDPADLDDAGWFGCQRDRFG